MKYEFKPRIDPKVKRFWIGSLIVTAIGWATWWAVGFFTGLWAPMIWAVLFAPIGVTIDWYRFKKRNNII